MTRLGYPPVIVDIVEEHFEELDFLWQQREAVIFAPDWDLEALAHLENRALAHLDGLRVGQEHAVDIARPALAGEETSAATAATLLLMDLGAPERVEELWAAFESAEAPEARDGIRLGLRHSSIGPVRERLLRLAADGDPAAAAAAADVLAFQRVTVPDLQRLLGAEDGTVRALVLASLGRLQAFGRPQELSEALADPDRAVQRAGLRAAALSGMVGLEGLCRAAVMDRGAPSLEALAFLGVFGNPADRALLEAAVRDAERAEPAISALGALGRVEAIPVLIELMREGEERASAAANALVRIAGAVDIHSEKESSPPAAPGDWEAEFDDDEPALDAEKAAAWWQANAWRFTAEGRWQGGVEVSDAEALRDRMTLQVRRDLYLAGRAQADGTVPDVELEARVVS